MRGTRAGVLVLCASCSFVAVHGPTTTNSGPKSTCTDSALIPGIDAMTGALLVAGSIGGEIAAHVATKPFVSNYELVIGLPALVVGITYLVAASKGTNKVSNCQATKRGIQDERGCDGCPAALP
jgi:hypothetical protein